MSVTDAIIDYDYLTQRALRTVLRDVLARTEREGRAPGEHHFYIEFETHAEGVSIPQFLRDLYPQRMTIVLQLQFQDLSVNDDGFEVTLWFKGRQARLVVPFLAVTSFADPSVQFGLRFDASGPRQQGAPRAARENGDDAPVSSTAVAASPSPQANSTQGAAVVSLDAFRKK